MSDQPYTPDESGVPPDDDRPAEDSFETEEVPPLADWALPPEPHEMPTRRITRIDLDMTQPSGADRDPDPLGMAQPTGDEDILGVTRRAGTAPEDFEIPSDWYEDRGTEGDAFAAVPPPRSLLRDELPTRTYSRELPYTVSSTPPIYGSFEEQRQRSRRGRTARERRESGLYLPWWSLLILLGVVAFFAALLFLGLNLLGGQYEPGGETPVFIVITSTPTPLPTSPPVTPTVAPLFATPTVIPFPGAVTAGPPDEAPLTPLIFSPVPSEPPQPDPNLALSVGATVVVMGTEGAGLNVRGGAGIGFDVLLTGAEGSQFEVIGGPVEADGFVWWQIREIGPTTRQGWAVEDFLAVLP